MCCLQCNQESPEGAKFCSGCGTPLAALCGDCGAPNQLDARFCGQCSAPLGAKPSPIAASAPEAERRQLTVLFCDLVGSTALSERLDPEELREVVRAYQECGARVIARHDGHIAQYLGDGLLVYFGYPVAHEDDGLRAVRAGLELLQAVAALDARGQRLQVRIGIHTGLVVVGEVGGGKFREQLALGETPNLAARVQSKAEPETLVISAATSRLVRGFFALEDLGEHGLKGLSRATRLYRVLNETGARSRMDAATADGFTPFVGREHELEVLVGHWARAVSGSGQVVCIRGEPGIGKSRLLQMLGSRLPEGEHFLLECRCLPYYQNSALYPVMELFERQLELRRLPSPVEKLARLREFLAGYGLGSPEALGLMASLLSLPLAANPVLEIPAQKKRHRTLELLGALLCGFAEQHPLVFVLEDLHWADPSTLELTQLLVDRASSERLLCLFTTRPGFHVDWAAVPHLHELELPPLKPGEAAVMVAHVTGNKSLPAELERQVLARSEGTPLFVEELTKAILEAGVLRERENRYELAGRVPDGLIPVSVHDSLMARIDRLGPSKPLAQLAATLGREFRYEVLKAVAGKEDEVLQGHLSKLLESELVYQQGAVSEAVFVFKHALIRDAAYESLLRKTRKQYHEQIARTLQHEFPEVADTQPELMASHYEGAELPRDALREWEKAGQRAMVRGANREAIAHLRRALTLLEQLPEEKARLELELPMQLELAAALMAIDGWASPVVEAASCRARDLCYVLGDQERLLPALWCLWTFHFIGGHLEPALETARQVMDLAWGSKQGLPRLLAHYAMGQTHLFRGEFLDARWHGEQGLLLFELEQERLITGRFQLSPTMNCQYTLAASLWMLGYRDQAERVLEEMFTLARTLGHVPSIASAMGPSLMLRHYQQDVESTWRTAQELFVLSNEQGFRLWEAVSFTYRAWAHSRRGDSRTGITELRQGIQRFRDIGGGLALTGMFVMLGEVLMLAGQYEEALAALAEGMSNATTRGEHLCEPELHRLRGEVLRRMDRTSRDAARGSFQQAIRLARHQRAWSLELRAVLSLSKMLDEDGQQVEAVELLRDIYSGFTEGLNTPDLCEARALLEKLRRQAG
ncbi:AAA family ATPase [Cystobacter fuscus]|uniref:adenylate/guanylate cyclase domain-containing protein n=1 Tax=Cystobacter fuscus TaxID=43 RepID=UPI002B2C882A|nr:AAA family ATPase [Cystobacter fuscus]